MEAMVEDRLAPVTLIYFKHDLTHSVTIDLGSIPLTQGFILWKIGHLRQSQNLTHLNQRVSNVRYC